MREEGQRTTLRCRGVWGFSSTVSGCPSDSSLAPERAGPTGMLSQSPSPLILSRREGTQQKPALAR